GASLFFFFFFQAEDGIRDFHVTGVQTCALPIWPNCSGGPTPAASSCTCPTAAISRTWACTNWCGAAAASSCAWTQRPTRRARSRSEERRVGKECSSRGATYHSKKK